MFIINRLQNDNFMIPADTLHRKQSCVLKLNDAIACDVFSDDVIAKRHSLVILLTLIIARALPENIYYLIIID